MVDVLFMRVFVMGLLTKIVVMEWWWWWWGI